MDLLNVGPVKPIGYMNLLSDNYIPQLSKVLLENAKQINPDIEYYISKNGIIQRLEKGLILPSKIYAVSRKAILRLLELNPIVNEFLINVNDNLNGNMNLNIKLNQNSHDPVFNFILLLESVDIYELNKIYDFILPFLRIAFGVETSRNTIIKHDQALSEERFIDRYLRFTNPLPPWISSTPILNPLNSKTINDAKVSAWLNAETAQPCFAALI
jgi:hypothetical protein